MSVDASPRLIPGQVITDIEQASVPARSELEWRVRYMTREPVKEGTPAPLTQVTPGHWVLVALPPE